MTDLPLLTGLSLCQRHGPRSVSLEVVLSTVQRTETRMELVAAPPKPPTKGRKKKAGAKK